ncbi:MAG TPA: DNA-3-methyladenine glycosylase [Candidatus Saccharimonadales bacterium]|nr:DNA-3-methyladenine glycosylase [Candidatus Saccharimonadales bacterium]
MFGPPGRLYVYFTYGMHYCCNVVVEKKGYGAAVLIRSVEPIDNESIKILQKNRKAKSDRDLTNGPAKLCQALEIDNRLNGHNLNQLPLRLIIDNIDSKLICSSKRIGISKEKEKTWRFYLKNSKSISV